MKAVIIDDEKHARENLRGMLAEYCPDIKVIGEAPCIETAEQLINALNPDLLFLDIRLSNKTGFDLLGKLESGKFGVIFVTAYDSYALKAIRFSAVDYILKPVHYKDLIRAVRKYTDQMNLTNKASQLHLLIENLTKERAFNRIGVNTEESIEFLVVKEIIRLQGESNYTRIFLKSGKSVIVSKTLAEFEELLKELGFIRTHKTHLVNIDCVKSIQRNRDVGLTLLDGTAIPVSRRRKTFIFDKLKTAFKKQ